MEKIEKNNLNEISGFNYSLDYYNTHKNTKWTDWLQFDQTFCKPGKQGLVGLLHLKKSPEESWVTETGFFLSEVSNAINNLDQWMKPKTVGTNLLNLPSKSYVMTEPLGVVLIISPWNYPLQLLFTPLAGAIAAGNCVVLKPSEFAPATAAVMKKIIDFFHKDI